MSIGRTVLQNDVWTRVLLVAMISTGAAMVVHGQATGPAVADQASEEGNDSRLGGKLLRPAFRFSLLASDTDQQINRFIEQMTLEEKIGQLVQVYPHGEGLSETLAEKIRRGEIGSVFYPGKREVVDRAQDIAIKESRLGVPLLIARDVVHGLKTVFPIPLGQAATWNPKLVEKAAAVAAGEARSESIDWTFAPMVDVCRDSRWGRIAETLGEDPWLAGELAAAMVRGFQQERDGKIHGVIACAKHFAGYGFSEGGRDYNRVSLSQSDLHNVVLPPFKRAVDSNCRTLMTSFSDLNGVPATGHPHLLRGVLKRDWGFSGLVVSDWSSVTEMVAHGFAEDNAQAAERAILAGVDMDMCSPAYQENLAKLIRSGRMPIKRLDDAVRRVLRCKVELAERRPSPVNRLLAPASLEVAREVARQSVVLLKNSNKTLPLDATKLKRIAIIGPLADSPKQQLGCWAIDGQAEDSVTPLADLRERLKGAAEIQYVASAKNSFTDDESGIADAVQAASDADAVLLFVGEDAVLSGEARCRTSLNLPGLQPRLVREVANTGVPTVVVFLAGRPLTIADEVAAADAVLYAWHPGTMAGPAINDLLFGDASPSGKLPVTFPRSVGQTPIYYNHTNTGRPSPENFRPLIGSGKEDLPGEFQYRSHYLDEEIGPLFPFGYGLSYASFRYEKLRLQSNKIQSDGEIIASVRVTNTSGITADEVVQLYVRDVAATSIRPIRELKAYHRIRLSPGESRRVDLRVKAQDLGYYEASGQHVVEPGRFRVGVGGDSTVKLTDEFQVLNKRASIAPTKRIPLPTAVTKEHSIR